MGLFEHIFFQYKMKICLKIFFFTNNVDMFKGPITKWPLHQNTRKTKPEVTDIYKH